LYLALIGVSYCSWVGNVAAQIKDKKMINSNPLDQNGLQITEGARVLWSNPDRYEDFGFYTVDKVYADVVRLVNHYRPHGEYAGFEDLKVQVR
jgi:hypothetical protein